MTGSKRKADWAASVSAIDRVVAYRRLAPGYQWRRLWAVGFWSTSVVVLSVNGLTSLHPSVAVLGVVSLWHVAFRLQRPGMTATESVVLDFMAALGVIVLTAPPAAIQMAMISYLLGPMLMFLSISQAGRLTVAFVGVAVVTGVADTPWSPTWDSSDVVMMTAVTALAAGPMAIWGYRRVAGHLHENASLSADLARRDREFRDLWEGAAVALYRVDMEGRFLRMNRRMADLAGFDRTQGLEELHAADLWADREGYEEWTRRLVDDGEISDFEWEIHRCDGTTITVRDTARVVTDAAGQPLYVEGSMEDVTDRIETTRQLRFHASILDHVRSAVVATDPDGIVTYWNRHAERLHGWTAEETIGRRIFEFVQPAAPEVAKEILTDVRERGYWEGETEMRRSDGTLVPTRTVAGTLRDADENPIGSVGVSADITDLKRANRRLERLLESKDQFISAVSHELRTPLAGLVGFLDILRSHSLDEDDHLEFLQTVSEQAEELSRIVEDLLVAARLDQDDLAIRLQEVEVSAVVDNLLSGWKDAAEVQTDGLDVTVMADPLRLNQILRNLVTNALQYGEAPHRIVSELKGGRVAISVIDHGPGIPDDLEDDIFHPYQQAEIDRARPSHLGLGLHVARSLAELMNGALEYHSRDDASWFTLTLPGTHSWADPADGFSTDECPSSQPVDSRSPVHAAAGR